jgi:signal transduction histidine kinase
MMADQDKMYEVIRHLIENAVKFTFDGEVTVSNEVNSKSAIIKVSDTGVGIPEEDQKNVFTKFFQSGRFGQSNPLEQQGAGLGLFISKHVVELHGGQMEFQSQEGKGSTFTVTLPIATKQ